MSVVLEAARERRARPGCVGAQILVMIRLVAAIVGRMERLDRSERLALVLALRLILALLLILVLLLLVLILRLILALYETDRAELRRIGGVAAQILVMIRLVAAVVGRMERLRRAECLALVLALRLILALHEAAHAHLRRIGGVAAQILVMIRLVAAIVRSMERSGTLLLLLLLLLLPALVLVVLRLHRTDRLVLLLEAAVLGLHRRAGNSGRPRKAGLLLVIHGLKSSLKK